MREVVRAEHHGQEVEYVFVVNRVEDDAGTLISRATVVTVNERREMFEPGSIYVRDGRIMDIGPSEQVESRNRTTQRVIDARGRVALPGFVSVHNHLGYSIFRGRAEDVGHGAVMGLYVPMTPVLTSMERARLAALSTAELLRGGVTTILQMEEDAEFTVPFVEAIGMRARIGIMASDLDVDALAQGRLVFSDRLRGEQLERAAVLAEDLAGRAGGRLAPVLAANTAATSSSALLRGLRETAERVGAPLSIHLGIGEASDVRSLHGAGVLEFCRDNGFLDESVIAVHCYQVDEHDLDLMVSSGAALAHCPLMNQFRGAIAPIEEMRKRGVRVGLGIDNFFSDYFDVIRARIAVARIRGNDPALVQSMEALANATTGSAEVLGWGDDIGSLEVGKKADIQLVDTARYGLTPINDPVRTLVYHGHAKDIEMVMVDGRIVVENGCVVGVDERALIDEVAGIGAAVWERFRQRYGGYCAIV